MKLSFEVNPGDWVVTVETICRRLSPLHKAYRERVEVDLIGLSMAELVAGRRRQVTYVERVADGQIVERTVSIIEGDGDA